MPIPRTMMDRQVAVAAVVVAAQAPTSSLLATENSTAEAKSANIWRMGAAVVVEMLQMSHITNERIIVDLRNPRLTIWYITNSRAP